jgi:hypothetical protein
VEKVATASQSKSKIVLIKDTLSTLAISVRVDNYLWFARAVPNYLSGTRCLTHQDCAGTNPLPRNQAAHQRGSRRQMPNISP